MNNDWIEYTPEGHDAAYVRPRMSQSYGMPSPGLHTNLIVMLTLLRIAREVYGWLVRAFIAGFASCLVIIAIFRWLGHH